MRQFVYEKKKNCKRILFKNIDHVLFHVLLLFFLHFIVKSIFFFDLYDLFCFICVVFFCFYCYLCTMTRIRASIVRTSIVRIANGELHTRT
jgi:hypothetical protein